MADTIYPGNAAPGDVRASKTFSAGTNYNRQGTLAEVAGGNTVTPGTANQTVIAANTIANSAITVAGDASLVASNIKAGATIFGVQGNQNVIDTTLPSGAAAASNILAGLYAFANGAKVTGSMPNNGGVTLTPSGTGTVAIPAGYHDGTGKVAQVSVPAADVLAGTTIAGVAGTMPNNGALGTITPGTANQALPAGYSSGGTVAGDPNLVPANILNGIAVFGVVGTVQEWKSASGTATSSASAININSSYPSGNANYYTLTVTGLSFTPKIVILSTGAYQTVNTIYDEDGYFFNKTSQIVDTVNNKGFNLTDNSGKLSVTNGSFTLPVEYPPNASFNWLAIGY